MRCRCMPRRRRPVGDVAQRMRCTANAAVAAACAGDGGRSACTASRSGKGSPRVRVLRERFLGYWRRGFNEYSVRRGRYGVVSALHRQQRGRGGSGVPSSPRRIQFGLRRHATACTCLAAAACASVCACACARGCCCARVRVWRQLLRRLSRLSSSESAATALRCRLSSCVTAEPAVSGCYAARATVVPKPKSKTSANESKP
jgi:hypothetical protein